MLLCNLLTFILVVAFALPGQAADKKDKQKPEPVKAPIVLEGDELYFNDKTGEIFAKGKVTVTRLQDEMLGDLVRGNSKTEELWVDDSATFLQPGTNLLGTKIHYNYGTKTGDMLTAKGKIGKEFIWGQQIEMYPDKFVIHNGTITRCPAKEHTPDYRTTAERVEIWPGDKLIAYNAKVWIKNVVIYATPKYVKSLNPADQTSDELPNMGYRSGDGFYIKQTLEYPLGPKLSAEAELASYSKLGFKPAYALNYREKQYGVTLRTGNYDDTDGRWIKKEPELSFSYYSHPIGPWVDYTFDAVYGKWTDNDTSSWHQAYNLYFTRKPIVLNETMNLYLGTGLSQTRESSNNSVTDSYRYDITVDKRWSSKFSTWVGYHYIQNNTSLFDYNSDDLGESVTSGFTYRFDKMNAIGLSQSYDLVNHRIYDRDVTWYRNLHCWQADFTYRIERKQWRWDISVARW